MCYVTQTETLGFEAALDACEEARRSFIALHNYPEVRMCVWVRVSGKI